MSEDLLYSALLSKASQCPNTMEEAAYVAAYVNSAFGSLDVRMAKPFNPMLYETFEWDRRGDPEYGWRLITEQVREREREGWMDGWMEGWGGGILKKHTYCIPYLAYYSKELSALLMQTGEREGGREGQKR